WTIWTVFDTPTNVTESVTQPTGCVASRCQRAEGYATDLPFCLDATARAGRGEAVAPRSLVVLRGIVFRVDHFPDRREEECAEVRRDVFCVLPVAGVRSDARHLAVRF